MKLRMRYPLLALLLAGGLAGLNPALGAGADHRHDARHGEHAARLSLDHGRKWSSDEALREGMAAMRTEIGAQADAIRANRLDEAGYAGLAARIETAMARVVADCRLAPEADAQLHRVLSRVSEGVEAMKQGEHRRRGAAEVVSALNAYGAHFEHPGWKPLRRI